MSESKTYTCHIDKNKAGGRVDRVLTQYFGGISRARLQALMRDGYVLRNGTTAYDVSVKVRVDEIWVLHLPPAKSAIPKARPIPLDIIFEDDHLIVVDKSVGMVVHPAAGHLDDTLVNALLHHCSGSLSGIGGVTRPGIVHRLDKDTSGLIVAAKSDASHHSLAQQFASHSIKRTYLAGVWGRLKSQKGTIDGQIGRSPINRKKMAVLKRGGKFARTHFRAIGSRDDLISLVECRLETGRTHQIRVHMASIGHSVVGDLIYGRGRRQIASNNPALNKKLKAVKRQLLHARSLGFYHPITGEPLLFNSNNVPELKEIFPDTKFD